MMAYWGNKENYIILLVREVQSSKLCSDPFYNSYDQNSHKINYFILRSQIKGSKSLKAAKYLALKA